MFHYKVSISLSFASLNNVRLWLIIAVENTPYPGPYSSCEAQPGQDVHALDSLGRHLTA